MSAYYNRQIKIQSMFIVIKIEINTFHRNDLNKNKYGDIVFTSTSFDGKCIKDISKHL